MGKIAISVNGTEHKNLYPPFIIGASAIASGDDLIYYFNPEAAPALKKGVFEDVKGEGYPDLIDLVEGVQLLGGRILMCELGLEVHKIKKEELRDGVEIVGATTFVAEISDATLSFSF
ncbi:MAG: DsrE/DsrF/DrsH-like family protein [Candidatus Zixiibacteriota bacterium]